MLAQLAHRRLESCGDLVSCPMAAVCDNLASAAPDAVHEPVADAEYPGIENLVINLAGERRMIVAQRHHVRHGADREPPGATRQRLRPAGPDCVQHCATARSPAPPPAIPPPSPQSL